MRFSIFDNSGKFSICGKRDNKWDHHYFRSKYGKTYEKPSDVYNEKTSLDEAEEERGQSKAGMAAEVVGVEGRRAS